MLLFHGNSPPPPVADRKKLTKRKKTRKKKKEILRCVLQTEHKTSIHRSFVSSHC
uniref:Uncharacterized protein n=1 Tax=Arundo donax TaxID=35708 RepID=A0A0A9DBX1_ARUDO